MSKKIMYYLYLYNNQKESGENTSQKDNVHNPCGIPLIEIIIFVYFVGESKLSGKEVGGETIDKREMRVSLLEGFMLFQITIIYLFI